MKNSLSITLCGDVCPTRDTLPNFLSENTAGLFMDVLEVFDNSDVLFGNLEYVLTDAPSPIVKSGPVLHAPTGTVKILKKAGFNLLSLANNHIKDCGEEGVKATISACKEAGVDIFGAGENLHEAKKPFITEIKGFKIGFIAFSEQEFNTATENSYGAGFFDPLEDLDLIEATKKNVDFLIVIYHGGVEYYEYPSPLQQRKCRKFIEKGADLVLCQHSHCIGSYEDYQGKVILYGQGNTVFGYREGNEQWNRGLLVQLLLERDKRPSISFTPVTATSNGGIRLLDAESSRLALRQLDIRSDKLKDDGFISSSWEKFTEAQSRSYLPYLLGFGRALIHLNRFSKNRLVRFVYSKKRLKTSLNIIRCEAHNEVVQSILKRW